MMRVVAGHAGFALEPLPDAVANGVCAARIGHRVINIIVVNVQRKRRNSILIFRRSEGYVVNEFSDRRSGEIRCEHQIQVFGAFCKGSAERVVGFRNGSRIQSVAVGLKDVLVQQLSDVLLCARLNRNDHVQLRADGKRLAVGTGGGVIQAVFVGSPVISVGALILHRFFIADGQIAPFLRKNLLSVPHAAIHVKLADLCQVFGGDLNAAVTGVESVGAHVPGEILNAELLAEAGRIQQFKAGFAGGNGNHSGREHGVAGGIQVVGAGLMHNGLRQNVLDPAGG